MLLDAANDNNLGKLQLALRNNADINAQHKNGWTALTFAATIGHLEIVKLLLYEGALILITPNKRWLNGSYACI